MRCWISGRRVPESADEAKTLRPNAAMTRVQRLQHVFKIDSDVCEQCGVTILNTSRKQTLGAGLSALSKRPVLARSARDV